MAISEEKRADAAEEAAKRIAAARDVEIINAIPTSPNQPVPGGPIIDPNAPIVPLDQIAPPPVPKEHFDAWKMAFGELKAAGRDAVGGLAAGFGSFIQSWVQYGTVGPNALRKMTSAVLASVASQAAVEAVYSLAKGFAALALGPFGGHSAAFWFTSAAIFGSIAGISAGLGRAIAPANQNTTAGSSFQQSSNTAGQAAQASGFGGGSSNTSNNPQARAIEQDRNRAGRGDIPLHVEFGRAVTALQSAADAVRNVVSRVALDLNIKTDERHEAELVSKHLDGALSHSYRNNGKLRELILQGVNE